MRFQVLEAMEAGSENVHRGVDLSGDRTKLSAHAMSFDDNDSRQVEFLSLIPSEVSCSRKWRTSCLNRQAAG